MFILYEHEGVIRVPLISTVTIVKAPLKPYGGKLLATDLETFETYVKTGVKQYKIGNKYLNIIYVDVPVNIVDKRGFIYMSSETLCRMFLLPIPLIMPAYLIVKLGNIYVMVPFFMSLSCNSIGNIGFSEAYNHVTLPEGTIILPLYPMRSIFGKLEYYDIHIIKLDKLLNIVEKHTVKPFKIVKGKYLCNREIEVPYYKFELREGTYILLPHYESGKYVITGMFVSVCGRHVYQHIKHMIHGENIVVSLVAFHDAVIGVELMRRLLNQISELP